MGNNELNVSTTARGFALIEFKDRYGVACSLQKSSLATDDAIWLGCDDADPKIMASKAPAHGVQTDETCGWIPYPVPDEVSLTTRMHLTRDQVEALLPILQNFVATGNVTATPAQAEPSALPELPQPLRIEFERPHGMCEMKYYTEGQVRDLLQRAQVSDADTVDAARLEEARREGWCQGMQEATELLSGEIADAARWEWIREASWDEIKSAFWCHEVQSQDCPEACCAALDAVIDARIAAIQAQAGDAKGGADHG